MKGKTAQPAASTVTAAAALTATTPAQRIISEPIAVTPHGTDTAGATTTAAPATDAEAQKKAFEDAVKLKMQAEMMKLQDAFTAELKQKQSKNAPVVSTPAAPQATQAQNAPADDRSSITAAQLDQQRRDTRAETVADAPRTVAPAPVQTQTTAPAPAVAAPAPVQQAVATVREGDVVDVGALDVLPRIVRPMKPIYPPLAARQKIAATIVLTVLVSETGEVLDVRVLRGEPRFGLNEAAMRAMRGTRFSSPMKEGKRVRTWFPQSIEFKAAS
jgi:TonB family protein